MLTKTNFQKKREQEQERSKSTSEPLGEQLIGSGDFGGHRNSITFHCKHGASSNFV